MAYKFQFGQAILSGNLDQEGDVLIKDQSGNTKIALDDNGAISGSGAFHAVGAASFGATLATTGSITSGGGVAAGGAISAATSIDGSGDLTMGTITMTGFSVDADGDTIVKTLATPDDGTIGSNTNADLLTLAAAAVTVKANSDFTVAKAGGLNLADGAVTSTAAELNLVDGSSAATVVNSKAVIYGPLGGVNANALSGTLRYKLDAEADGGIGLTPFQNSADVSNLKISGSYMQETGPVVASEKFVGFSSSGSVKQFGMDAYATAIAGDGLVASSGVLAVSLSELTEAAVNVSADSLIFLDADGNVTRKDTFADYATAIAGVGLAAASGELALDLNELGAAAIAAGDSLAFIDATDSNATKKETVDDLATLFAGNGLSAASAVLALDLNELTAAAVDVANDSIAIVDANDSNASKKESIADVVTAIAGAGLSATSGVLSVQGNAVAGFVDGAAFSEGYNFASGSAGGAASLPASPSVGDVVTVKASNAGEIRINTAGSHTIDGEDSILLESPFAAVTMVYMAANAWKIV